MLGAVADMTYTDYSYKLAPGDLYAAYTDGLTEARRDKLFWGQDGLIDTVRDAAFVRGESLSTVADEVARTAKDWASGRQQDDVCLILVRRL